MTGMMHTLRLGETEIISLHAGDLWYDGGATFGAVPRPIWERLLPPDDRNRVRLSLRPVLIRHRGHTVLVDSGFGSHQHERLRQIYSLEGDGSLRRALSRVSTDPGSVDTVLFSHLHVDHAGGAVERHEGELVPALPAARFVVQQGEWESASNLNSLTRAGYMPRDLKVLESSGRLERIEGDTEVIPGIRLVPAGGHTPWHQVVLVETEEGTVLLPGDLAPTTIHLRLPYITALDLNRLETFRQKSYWLDRAAREGWYVVLYHEPGVPIGRLVERATGRYDWEPAGQQVEEVGP